jgi:SAM-dependent methyltransferase
MRRELLLGAGRNLAKKITIGGASEWSNLTTLDFNRDHMPDITADLDQLPYHWAKDDEYDEVHAYEVMEHLGGHQGNWRFFFRQWSEIWRMLKPGGFFAGTCPARDSVWAWGDPSHTRVIQPESLVFLCQPKYAQVGITPMSDFRFVYKADFEIIHAQIQDGTFIFVLQAVKPSRVTTAL